MNRPLEGSDAAPLAGFDWAAITHRPAFAVDEAAVQRRVRGHAVLITGAAGSLGAPLAHSLAAAGPAKLVLYDQHESSLFRLRQALAAAAPGVALHAVLADVREPRRLWRVVGDARPDLIFHLAAYKHVPWGEEDPEAFAATNILGTRHVIDAARASGVAQIVYPSTDKAISPPSLYGATKRLSEAMLRAAATAGGPRSVIIRFVNVLGSQGSAPETFARQIRAGRALSITDPHMRRYWITPEHANLLLLHAACLGGPDEPTSTVAPNAGDEITIMDIARRMWSALTPALIPTSPEKLGQPAIAITGPRPGERLAEPLTAADETLEPLPLPGLLRVRGIRCPAPEAVEDAVQRVAALLEEDASPAALREALFRPI